LGKVSDVRRRRLAAGEKEEEEREKIERTEGTKRT
jgi:hypothetical protein